MRILDHIIIFTFYCSSIKGVIAGHYTPLKKIFTFYCSSIKGKMVLCASAYPCAFTFYCSSIKGSGSAPSFISRIHLHSTVVLLKVCFTVSKIEHVIYLHSTVVLLKVTLPGCLCRRLFLFTFYCSSIKGQINLSLHIKNKEIYILL